MESCHPVYADLIDVHFEIEMEDRAHTQRVRRRRASQARRDPERSLEPSENKWSSQNRNPASRHLIENTRLTLFYPNLLENKDR